MNPRDILFYGMIFWVLLICISILVLIKTLMYIIFGKILSNLIILISLISLILYCKKLSDGGK